MTNDNLPLIDGKPYCGAGKDGDCTRTWCPQLKDSEPETTGRSCPLADWGDDCD